MTASTVGGFMTTFGGTQFSHANPRADDVHLVDIAHALSMLCHWGGHAREFFSVAQHSLLVSYVCPPALMEWGLLHDAAEAYCGDMIRPLKVLLPEYKTVETRVLRAIAERFALDWPEPPALKAYDNAVLLAESKHVMPSTEALHDGFGRAVHAADVDWSPLHATALLRPMSPRMAKALFLARARELGVV